MAQDTQPSPIKLYAPQGNRDGSVLKDSRLYNGFAEKAPDSDDVWVYKRPGLLLYANWTAGVAGEGQGVTNWLGAVYAVIGGNLWEGGNLIGAISGAGMFTFSACLGATPKLSLKSATTLWNYDPINGLVQVIDVDYPVLTVPGIEYLDGTTYVFEPSAHIDGDDFNDPTSWDPLNTLIAQIEPDAGVALAKQLVYIVALKAISTEVFYDAGNATGSPLGPVQGSKMNVGCKAGGSVRNVGGDLAWIGTTTLGAVRVMFMSAVKGEAISTPPVERYLSPLDYTTTYSWAMEVSGHIYYGVTIKNSNVTIVFDRTSNAWYLWTDGSGNYLPIVDSTFDSHGTPVLQHETNGMLYTAAITQFTDDGIPFPVDIYTENWDGGLRLDKTVTTGEVLADQIATTVNVSWSDDDYQTFSTPVVVDLNQERPMFDDGSTFRRRAYHVNNLDSTFFRIKALHINADPGTA